MAFPLNPGSVSVQESWYEKLNRWEEALEAYERKYQNTAGTPAYVDAALGRLRRDTFLCSCHADTTHFGCDKGTIIWHVSESRLASQAILQAPHSTVLLHLLHSRVAFAQVAGSRTALWVVVL